jgi:hypothetical protein
MEIGVMPRALERQRALGMLQIQIFLEIWPEVDQKVTEILFLNFKE